MKTPNTILVNGKRKVCRIHDLGGGLDRYTICLKGYRSRVGMVYPYLASSVNPTGYSGREESKEFMTGNHLGKRISFDELPEAVQRFVLDNI
jgi:hypothetical protein